MQLTLLSRRKWNGAGTRYNARGINDQGYVANFCETEQILVVNNRFLISHVQIRGSVPVFWEQRGLAEDVNLTRNPEMTKKPFQTHFKRIVDSYGPCQVINLLRYNVPREVRLTTEYVRQVHESPYKNKIKFLNFDFHGFCGGDRYQALKVMIQRVDTEILKQGYLIEHLAQKQVEMVQRGVIRTNCLDSLDRTNVAQSKVGMVVLQLWLKKLGFDLEAIAGPLVHTEGLAFMYEEDETSIIQQFRAMWTEMGDYLSRQYAGTDSTISRVTRDGKEGFLGKLDHKTKVVRRFLINTLSENPMQTSIDIIQGKHLNTGYSSEQKLFVDE